MLDEARAPVEHCVIQGGHNRFIEQALHSKTTCQDGKFYSSYTQQILRTLKGYIYK